MSKLKELQEEILLVLAGRGMRLLDSLLPLLIFLIVNTLTKVDIALWSALVVAVVLAVYRIFQKESLVYALGGLGGVLLASVFVQLSGSGSGFFIPGLISGAITVVLCVVTVILNRPLVALTSYMARRWPLGWYWHPKVLPVYNEVTIAWAVTFSIRLVLEIWLYQKDAVNALGTVRFVLGWPLTLILLVASYLFGLWRLRNLAGPSVEEYINNTAPPWQSQQRGF